jgi:transposase
MGQKGRPTTLQERIEIGERWEAGETDPEIAKAMDRSVWVVRKWRRRYQRESQSGLISCMGRPPTGALGQFPRIREIVRGMREANPGWGPDTIGVELAKDSEFENVELPSRSRIAAFLNQEGYTRSYERHSELPQPEKKVTQDVHEEWEMDAQGVVDVNAIGRVSIINIIDVRSHLKVESFPCMDTSHPNTQHYQLILRRAFLQYGLPKCISLDRDSVFYDNTCASPYPTTLHLWLIALGVDVRFIEDPPPTEHSLIERTHQTIYQQAVVGQTFTDADALQQRLSERRNFLNHDFPSRTLKYRSPLQAYPEARHSGKPYHPKWEEAILDIQRIYDYLAQGRWFRRSSLQGQFSLGAHCYNAGRDFAEQQLIITFDPQERKLVCCSEDGKEEIRFPIQGLSKSELMKELTPLVTLPMYQLALPFSPDAWREIMLCDNLTGTTL